MRFLDSNYLQAIQQVGIDLLYSFTGKRHSKQPDLTNELKALSDAWETINSDLAGTKQ
nr:hypothetical protein [Alcaligenes faecalis]